MTQHDGATLNMSNIPNEDPQGLAETHEQDRALTYAYQREIEAMQRMLGGHPKMAVFPAVAPESQMEDIDLHDENLSVEANFGPGAELQDVKGMGGLNRVEDEDSLLVTAARGGRAPMVYGDSRPASAAPDQGRPVERSGGVLANSPGGVNQPYDWADGRTPPESAFRQTMGLRPKSMFAGKPVGTSVEARRSLAGAVPRYEYYEDVTIDEPIYRRRSLTKPPETTGFAQSLQAKGVSWVNFLLVLSFVIIFIIAIVWARAIDKK